MCPTTWVRSPVWGPFPTAFAESPGYKLIGVPQKSGAINCDLELLGVPALRVIWLPGQVIYLPSVHMEGMCLPHRLHMTLSSSTLNDSISSLAFLQGFSSCS